MTRIFLHGLGQTASSWRETVRGMERSEDILCPELFDLLHGRACTYGDLYAAFSEYCAAVPEPLGLCGLSLGGILALQYGLEHPQRVGAVALIGTQYVMPRRLLAVQNAAFRVLPDRAFRGMGLGKADAVRLCKSMSGLDSRRELHRLTCPALVACGERDRANRRSAEELTARLPRARLLVVKDAGHEVNADAPEALGRALNEFFRTHEA